MSLWCGRRWRKVRRPNRNLATAQEGSPRTKTIMVNIQHMIQNAITGTKTLFQPCIYFPNSLSDHFLLVALLSALLQLNAALLVNGRLTLSVVFRLLPSLIQPEARVLCVCHETQVSLQNEEFTNHKEITSLELDVINIDFLFSSSPHVHCLNPFLHPH